MRRYSQCGREIVSYEPYTTRETGREATLYFHERCSSEPTQIKAPSSAPSSASVQQPTEKKKEERVNLTSELRQELERMLSSSRRGGHNWLKRHSPEAQRLWRSLGPEGVRALLNKR